MRSASDPFNLPPNLNFNSDNVDQSQSSVLKVEDHASEQIFLSCCNGSLLDVSVAPYHSVQLFLNLDCWVFVVRCSVFHTSSLCLFSPVAVPRNGVPTRHDCSKRRAQYFPAIFQTKCIFQFLCHFKPHTWPGRSVAAMASWQK